MRVLPEITAGDHEVGLCGPEDVVDGSGGQHLPHGFVDDFLVLATAHRHRAQEAHGEHLLQERVCGNAKTFKCPRRCRRCKHATSHTAGLCTHLWRSGPLGRIYQRCLPSLSVEHSSSVSPNGFVRLPGRTEKHVHTHTPKKINEENN